MILSLIKAEGHSMEPKIKEGSFFIVSSIPFLFRNPKVDDYIIFEKNYKLIVKRIEKLDKFGIHVNGINQNDSKSFPPISKNDIKGVVLWIL